MICSNCNKNNACNEMGTHKSVVLFGNILLTSNFYCSSKCMLEDCDAFAHNLKKGLQCFARDAGAHASGTCPCGIL
jgi:hypothetical protein